MFGGKQVLVCGYGEVKHVFNSGGGGGGRGASIIRMCSIYTHKNTSFLIIKFIYYFFKLNLQSYYIKKAQIEGLGNRTRINKDK